MAIFGRILPIIRSRGIVSRYGLSMHNGIGPTCANASSTVGGRCCDDARVAGRLHSFAISLASRSRRVLYSRGKDPAGVVADSGILNRCPTGIEKLRSVSSSVYAL